MKCTIDMSPILTKDRDYPSIERFASITGWWYLVRCNDGRVRHFHESRFGGPKAHHRGGFLGASWMDKYGESLS